MCRTDALLSCCGRGRFELDTLGIIPTVIAVAAQYNNNEQLAMAVVTLFDALLRNSVDPIDFCSTSNCHGGMSAARSALSIMERFPGRYVTAAVLDEPLVVT